MNTNSITQNKREELPNMNSDSIHEKETGSNLSTNKEAEDTIYEAKIITTQPYGVYALCKIYEMLQIN
jgi:hypothetical protein